MLVSLALLAGLAADAPTAVPATSPSAEIITVTLGGIAAIITALAGFANLRRRRQAELDAAAAPAVAIPIPLDPEDRPARIRERLSAAETEIRNLKGAVGDLQEQVTLHRAVDVVTESAIRPVRRRRSEPSP